MTRPMAADDPRHGTSAGYIAGCRTWCCWQAKQRYDKRRRWEASQGHARKVPSIGCLRRIQALRALGWSVPRIADRAGIAYQQLYDLGRYPTVYAKTYRTIAETYEAMVHEEPPSATTGERHAVTKSKRTAARHGWPTPDRWFDIDDSDERPDPGYRERTSKSHAYRRDLDPVVVDRILTGDVALIASASRPEREAVIARWRDTGRSLNELERLTGLKASLYQTDVA